MSRCGKWERLITPYLMDELDAHRRQAFEAHLAVCEECEAGVELTRSIMSGAVELAREGDALTDDVQWGAVEAAILAASGPRRIPVFRYAVQTLMMICLALPVALLVTSVPVTDQADVQVTEQTVRRMETELARQEVSRYLRKSRLVLSDFMQQCSPDARAVQWEPSPAVRDLLTENRYFADDLDSYRLQNARDLCRKLNLVFAEMTTVESGDPCQDISRLQQIVERENLFLKIRLVEQELNMGEV